MQKGMSLLEVLVVIAITGVAGIALNSTIVSFYRNNAYLLEETQALNNARQGVGDAVRTFRECNYGEDGSYPISSAATSTITFYSDIDNDKAVEKVVYRLIGTTLFKTITNAVGSPPSYTGQPISTSTIAQYVRNSSTTPLFRYYDSSGMQLSTTTTDISKVASISVQLLVDLNPLRAPNVFTLTENATLRNLRNQ